MTQQVLDIVDFLKLMLDALKAARVEYLIGGAIAGWAWGEPRATQDVDMVINLPIGLDFSLSTKPVECSPLRR